VAPGAKSRFALRVIGGTWASHIISVAPRFPVFGRPAKLILREGDVDRDHYYGQDDRQDQQFPQDLTLPLRLHRVAFLQGVEPGVKPAGGQELLVAACFRDVSIFDHEDLVHVPHQPQLVGDDEGGAALG
jgi:hypothetical protein